MEALDAPNKSEEVKVSEWVVTLLITAVPLLGLIMLFVWGFGGNTNPNKANWAKAALIMYAVLTGLYFLFILTFGAAFMAAGGFD